jgi:hypothetical protein
MEEATIHPVDAMSDAQLMRELVEHFGTRRTTELFGWAALASVLAWPKSPAEFRKHLEASGFNKSSMYLALSDMRAFGEKIELREGWVPGRTVPADGMRLLRRLGSLRMA